MDSAMDDGDLARLLRRTIYLLAQVYYQAYWFSILDFSYVCSIFGGIYIHYHLHSVICLTYVPDSQISLTPIRRGKNKNASQSLLCIAKINSNKIYMYDRYFVRGYFKIAHLSPHMHFFVTHLSMNENACFIGDVKYLSLQNRMHF
jgi:hypothetical protein